MTIKLIKYEFRSSIGFIGILWAGLLAAGLLMGITNKVTQNLFAGEGNQVIKNLLEAIPLIIYFALFVAMIVATIIIVVVRFYKGLLGEEGYLMHTLPLKTWQLITAKGIVAAIVVIAGGIVAVLSVVTIICINDSREAFAVLSEIFKELEAEPILILIGFEFIILGIFGVLKSIYQVYASLCIGQLVNRHRILLAVGAYIGINIVLGVIFSIVVSFVDTAHIESLFEDAVRVLGETGLANAVMGVMILVTVIQLVIFHIVSERIMTKKLNLQ
ncbi:MAG: hypothetical protein ACOX4R_01240 [Lentihominibacter sp.]